MGEHIHELLHVAAATLFVAAGASALLEYKNLRERAVLTYALMCFCSAAYACHVVVSHNLPKHGQFWIPWTSAGLIVTFAATFFYLVAIRGFVALKSRLFLVPLAVQVALVGIVFVDLLRYAALSRSFMFVPIAREGLAEEQRELGEAAYSLLPMAQVVAALFMLSFVSGVGLVLVWLIRKRSLDFLLFAGLGVTSAIIVNDTLVAMSVYAGVYLIAFSKAFETVRIHRDIRVRSRERVERRLRQAEKMEAIGRVAGGIAHDFNNILAAVGGGIELAADAIGPSHPATADLRTAREGVQAGRHFVRQLLDVARSQQTKSEYIDINQFLSDSTKFLSSLLGRNTKLELRVEAAAGGIVIAPGQLTQVLMNLIVNARDAIPEGGVIEIRAGAASGRPGGPFRLRSNPGVAISVIDHGSGIPAEVLDHVFEPLFTTKGDYGGSGFGLATVYSIVQQAGGHIEVESEIGRGTSFHLLFPRAKRAQ